MRTRHLIFLLILAVLAGAEEQLDIPVRIDAPVQPVPVITTDGQRYFVYNFFITNFGNSDLFLRSVEVKEAATHALIVRYDAAGLEHGYRMIGTYPIQGKIQRSDLRRIAAGHSGFLFVAFKLPPDATVPRVLEHIFAFEPDAAITLLRDNAASWTLDPFYVTVSSDRPSVIGPPVRGGPWKCAGATSTDTGHQHQTTVGLFEGRATIGERFAVDFQKIDKQGNILPNPFPVDITNEMFYGYGEEVLAVADGKIARVVEGIPENVPQSDGSTKPAVPITRETVAGNWVSLEIAPNRYAFYAHLQPGSIRFHAGDRVKRGDVIGLLGNAGNAVGPHLHFSLGDRNSINGCEGIPFVIDDFDLVGPDGSITHRKAASPLQNDVVRFRSAR